MSKRLQDIRKNALPAIWAFISNIVPVLYHLIIIAVFTSIISSFCAVYYLKTPGVLQKQTNIIIPSGASTFSIAKQLSDGQAIEYPELFALIVKFVKNSKSLKAGEYAFTPQITPMEVINKIQNGDVVIRKLTIAEGLLASQALEIINNNEYLKGEITGTVTEGSILPETYEYKYGDSRKEIIKRMQDSMSKTAKDLWEHRKPGLPLNNINEMLTLASIIEKETSIAEERPRIAAVFINRLRKNMRLQTDPTVIYAITEGKYMLDRPLSHQDLEIDSKYNTYKYTGLPPAPIASPGKASIEAALNPLDTDEIYFVASGTGGHIFSTTLRQHNINVEKLRQVRSSQGKNQQD